MKLPSQSISILVATLGSLAASGFADTEATTDPVGIITLTVKGTGGTKPSEFTYLGLGLARPVNFQGLAGTVSGTTLTSSAATWTDNQYASTPAPGYFLEITSGAKTGLLTYILGCSDANNTLTVADNLTALGVESTNVTYRIRQNWSLGALFGATNSAGLGAGNLTTADLILIYNPNLGGGAGGYDIYYYSSGGLPGVGWRKSGANPANTNQANAPIALDEGLIIKRLQSADLSVSIPGAVKLGQTITTVFAGPNFIGNMYPSGVMTLGLTDLNTNPPKYSSSLFTGNPATGVVAGNLSTADLILIYNPTLGGGAGGYETYYYSNGGLPGTGWRKSGANPANTDQSGTPLASSQAIFLKRSVAAGPFNWVMPQPFPSPQ